MLFIFRENGGRCKSVEGLREFLRAGNEDSAKRLIQTLNPSSVVAVEKVDFTKLPKDILGTSLIPVMRVISRELSTVNVALSRGSGTGTTNAAR